MGSTPVRAGTQNNNTFQTLYPSSPQKLTVTSSSTQSAAFGESVSVVRLFSTKDCYVKFGSTPTATSSDIFLPGGIIQFFGVVPGEKLAVIRDTADGVLHILEGGVI